MIRLLIADDHSLMREALRQLFILLPDITLAGEASNGTQVLEKLRSGNIDLILLDLSMPGICGDELIARIRSLHPDLGILVLSMHDKPQFASRALKAGANGYVTKGCDPDMLLSATRRVAAGGRFLDPIIAQSMAFETNELGERTHHRCLSKRELQVMLMLSTGLSVTEIAKALTISDKTVSTHKARMFIKMGFNSSADLVRYVVEHELSG